MGLCNNERPQEQLKKAFYKIKRMQVRVQLGIGQQCPIKQTPCMNLDPLFRTGLKPKLKVATTSKGAVTSFLV